MTAGVRYIEALFAHFANRPLKSVVAAQWDNSEATSVAVPAMESAAISSVHCYLLRILKMGEHRLVRATTGRLLGRLLAFKKLNAKLSRIFITCMYIPESCAFSSFVLTLTLSTSCATESQQRSHWTSWHLFGEALDCTRCSIVWVEITPGQAKQPTTTLW